MKWAPQHKITAINQSGEAKTLLAVHGFIHIRCVDSYRQTLCEENIQS